VLALLAACGGGSRDGMAPGSSTTPPPTAAAEAGASASTNTNKAGAGAAAAASGGGSGGSSTRAAAQGGAGASAPAGMSTSAAGAAADGGSGGAVMPPAAGSGGSPAMEMPDVACDPKDMKPPAKQIPLTDIKDSNPAPIAPAKGPYPPIVESDPGLATHTIFRPQMLGAIKHPIVAWANGGCSKNGTLFARFLLEFATYGFVIVADGTPMGSGTGPLTTEAGPQKAAMDWIIAENERPCSIYYHKLDTTKVAAMGQSCGGLMTLGVSSDPRLTTVVIWNSGLLDPDQKIYDGLHTPTAYFIGGMDDVAYPQAEADFKAITKVPLFYANDPVGHLATYSEDNGGEFARVGIGWLKWQLLGDDSAAGKGMFAGPMCSLCVSGSMWTVQKKNMD
jgi:hypothetical protein